MNRRPAAVVASFGFALVALLAGLLVGEDLFRPTSVHAAEPRVSRPSAPAPSVSPSSAAVTSPSPPRSFAELESEVSHLLDAAEASGAVTLTELSSNQSWSLNGDETFVAASTYKLPLLMKDAEDIAAGRSSANDLLCYDSGDWEDGYFSDYEDGACYTRAELDRRVGIYSDNTAAHILVRYDGGADALNAYARTYGAANSQFYDSNTTTSNDLARLWQAEAEGRAGGSAAQTYLYPLLTNTIYEEGVPAGVPAGTTVVHKIGILDSELNDAALVDGGPRGSYVLTVCTDGGSWQLIAEVAQAVAQFEAS